MATTKTVTRMKQRRQQLRLTQQDVGYLARVSQADICRIETKRLVPGTRQAEKIGKVLKLDPAELQKPA